MKTSMGETKNMRWLWIALIIVVVAAVLFAITFFMFIHKKPYVAVYLVTGDIYYGRMAYSPKFALEDAVFLQKDTDGKLSLQKLSDAFWKPKGPMMIERDQIVFWTEVDSTSPIVSAIEGLPVQGATQVPADTTTPTDETTTPTTPEANE
jgi:hypothetical protein